MVKDTVLYIVRHGESMGNLARRLQGQTDFPLSPLGEEQAALAAQRLAGNPFPQCTPALLSGHTGPHRSSPPATACRCGPMPG